MKNDENIDFALRGCMEHRPSAIGSLLQNHAMLLPIWPKALTLFNFGSALSWFVFKMGNALRRIQVYKLIEDRKDKSCKVNFTFTFFNNYEVSYHEFDYL